MSLLGELIWNNPLLWPINLRTRPELFFGDYLRAEIFWSSSSICWYVSLSFTPHPQTLKKKKVLAFAYSCAAHKEEGEAGLDDGISLDNWVHSFIQQKFTEHQLYPSPCARLSWLKTKKTGSLPLGVRTLGCTCLCLENLCVSFIHSFTHSLVQWLLIESLLGAGTALVPRCAGPTDLNPDHQSDLCSNLPLSITWTRSRWVIPLNFHTKVHVTFE